MIKENLQGSPQRLIRLKGALPAIAALLLILPASPTYSATDELCADCHEEITTGYSQTGHGIYLSSNQSLMGKACQQCHGAGDAHILDNEPASIINPANTEQQLGDALCLSCHKADAFDGWSHSEHRAADVACASCHTIHTDGLATLKKSTPDLCYDCHSDVRASFSLPSHHPVAEGLMDCIDCHGAHGEDTKFAMGDTSRDLCFSCHAEKEGPFVYEHEPVNEDCNLCHSPHGTVANNLLTQNEPTICLNCHSMHFHATIEGVDGDLIVPLAPERNGTSTSDGFKTAMLTKCTQCHTAIHGTDHMSQTISTGGNALTR